MAFVSSLAIEFSATEAQRHRRAAFEARAREDRSRTFSSRVCYDSDNSLFLNNI